MNIKRGKVKLVEKQGKVKLVEKQGKVKLVEILKPAKKVTRKSEAVRTVNPRVTPKQAVQALKRFPGGKEVIKKLHRAGKKF